MDSIRLYFKRRKTWQKIMRKLQTKNLPQIAKSKRDVTNMLIALFTGTLLSFITPLHLPTGIGQFIPNLLPRLLIFLFSFVIVWGILSLISYYQVYNHTALYIQHVLRRKRQEYILPPHYPKDPEDTHPDVYHTAIIGPTGSGKTTFIFLPAVKDRYEKRLPVWIFDPKASHSLNPLYEAFDTIYVWNLSNPQQGNKGNIRYINIDPLAVLHWVANNIPASSNDIPQYLHAITDTLIEPFINNNNKFWHTQLKNLFLDVIRYLYKHNQPLADMEDTINKLHNNPHFLKAVLSPQTFQTWQPVFITDPQNPQQILQQINGGNLPQNLQATLSQAIPLLHALRAFSDNINPEPLAYDKTLLVITWNQASMNQITSTLMSLAYNTLRIIFYNRVSYTKNTISIFMDEIQQFNRIPTLDQDTRLARSYNVQLVFGIQDLAGFYKKYPNTGKSMIANTRSIVILPNSSTKETQELLNNFLPSMASVSITNQNTTTTTTQKPNAADILNNLGIFDDYREALIIEPTHGQHSTMLTIARVKPIE